MAGCELNVAHAFVATPSAHRLRHDVIVTSADDYDASRRRRCVQDDETETDRGGVMPHYRLVPSALGPGSSGEWVTLSKSVLLQLVERICQLSFQTENLTAAATTAACPPSASSASDRFETSSTALSTDIVKSIDTPSSGPETVMPGCLTPKSVATSSTPPADVVDISNTDSAGELMANSQRDISDVRTSDKARVASDDTDVTISQEVDVDGDGDDANCDENDDDGDDSEVFTSPVAMQELIMTDNSSSLADTSLPMSTSPDIAMSEDSEAAVVSDAVPAETRKSPSPTTSIRSTPLLHTDRRRRLRELRLQRRHRHTAVTGDNHDRCRDRRRFAMPRQPPPRFQDRQVADVELRPDGTTTDASSPMRLPVGCRHGRMLQPWSALNKLVVCQLVDVVLSQELTSTTAAWRSATASREKRRPSGVIWNPAITPETRECRNPTPPRLSQTVSDLSSLVSAEHGTSTLLHSLLSPMAAAAAAASTFLDCRRSEVSAADAEVGGGSLAWTLSQSSTGRRRHHSAAASDNFRVPWTSPSFFWYNVPPSQGNFFLMPDATSRPCYRWINATLPPTSVSGDASALDYRTQTLDAGGCLDAVDTEAYVAAEAVPAHPSLTRTRDSRPSTPPASVSSQHGAGARLKWVVVNKTDVCSLFESLASTMVTDSDEKRTSSEPDHQPMTGSGTSGTDQAPCVVSAASSEPIKWKSTLLRRARAEAQTPKRSDSDDDATESTRVLFHVDF